MISKRVERGKKSLGHLASSPDLEQLVVFRVTPGVLSANRN
jgi:hypothetical protein